MPDPTISDSYAAGLAAYLAEPNESTLTPAYEIGRRSLREGVGAVELVSAHSRALLPLIHADTIAVLSAQATAFLVECLAPLEMAYRGFTAANETLRKLNAGLQQANADLIEANTELDQFAYLAAHDLSEPLRGIAGPLQLLARRYEGHLDAEGDDFIGLAVRACVQMSRLLDDLVVYTEAGYGQAPTQAVDCNAAVASALTDLGGTVRSTGAFVTVDRLPVVAAEPAALTRVFRNLISNALKFTAPGVTPEVRISAEQIDGLWRISVIDNGIGVDPEYRTRIFGMAKRLHNHDDYPGSGIGLALTKKLVTRYRGALGIDDSPTTTGSRFWFTLPAGPVPDAAPAASAAATAPRPDPVSTLSIAGAVVQADSGVPQSQQQNG